VTRDEFWSLPFDHLSTDCPEKFLERTCDIVKSIAIKTSALGIINILKNSQKIVF